MRPTAPAPGLRTPGGLHPGPASGGGHLKGSLNWALEYHTLILFLLKGTIMKKKVYT